MAENFDKLICGNCGYDGGRAHLAEKLQWQKELSKMDVSDSVRDNRVIGATISVIACTAIVAMTIWATTPSQQPTADESWSKTVQHSYERCVGTVAQMERQQQMLGLQNCNDSFKEHMRAAPVME